MKSIMFPILLICFSSVTCAQINLDSGLLAYYPFNGNADDISGNKNNPVFNNASLSADRLGNPNSAYHFNGKNNCMKVPNAPTLNAVNEMSISLWVKATGFYTGKCSGNSLLMKGDNDNKQGNYFLRFEDPYTGCSKPDFTKEIFQGPAGVLATTPVINLNQWYSVVWVCDNNTVSLYVDSVLRSSVQDSYNSFSNRYDLFIGRHNDPGFPYWFNGDLDEIRIYNRALSKEEVLLLSNKKQNPSGNTSTIIPASGKNAAK